MPPKLLAPQMFLICYSWMPSRDIWWPPKFSYFSQHCKIIKGFSYLDCNSSFSNRKFEEPKFSCGEPNSATELQSSSIKESLFGLHLNYALAFVILIKYDYV